ncbi:type III effector, partial [Pseudomonas sp. ST1]
MHVLENMTKVKYAKQGELKAQWTQKVSTDVSMFGLAGQFTPSIVNKLAAAICGGAGHIPNAVVGFLGAYSLAASFIGAQTQFAAINAKNNFREGNPKPTSLETFMRGNLAPVMQASANRHSQHALQGAEQAISTARQALNS